MARKVAVLGASPNPARVSNRAVKSLVKAGHEVVPVTPRCDVVEGLKTVPDLDCLEGPVDTVTVYLAPEKVISCIPAIMNLKPSRVVLNPGAESPHLEEACKNAGIKCVKDCTLIMLNSGRF